MMCRVAFAWKKVRVCVVKKKNEYVCVSSEREDRRQACLPCNQGCVSEITEMRLTGSNLAKAPSLHLIYQLLVCMQPIQLARAEGLRT